MWAVLIQFFVFSLYNLNSIGGKSQTQTIFPSPVAHSVCVRMFIIRCQSFHINVDAVAVEVYYVGWGRLGVC